MIYNFADSIYFENDFVLNQIEVNIEDIYDDEPIFEPDINISYFNVISEGEKGLGVQYIGENNIPSNTVLAIGWGYISDRLNIDDFTTALGILKDKNVYLLNNPNLPMSILGFVNHSCDPNCIFVVEKVKDRKLNNRIFYLPVLVNIKTIHKNDVLTVDYKWTPFNKIQEIKCLCKSQNCRKWLRPPVKQKENNSSSYTNRYYERKNNNKRAKEII